MEVERTASRHVPNHFGQHTERHNYLQVSLPGTQSLQKSLVLQLLGLQQRDIMRQGIFLNGTELHLVSTASRFVGHGDDTHYVISALHQGIQRRHRKVRRAHIYDA